MRAIFYRMEGEAQPDSFKQLPASWNATRTVVTEEPDYSAMTVIERLFVSNRMKEFDQAVLLCNRADATQILADLDVSNPEKTVDAIFGDPGKYGFY